MAGKKATVFGATGFLGRRVVATLAGAGMEVVLASRHPDAEAPDQNPRLRSTYVDVTEPETVARAVDGSEVVANCVGLYVEQAGETFDGVHVKGARNVASAAASAGVAALVSISGIGSDPTSSSPYVSARGRGEQAVREAFPNAVILRPSVMFAPGDSFMTAIARIARLAPVYPLFGDGSMRLQPVFAGDVAQAILRAASAPSALGGTFELAGPDVVSYRDLVRRVMEWSGHRRPCIPLPFAVWRLMAASASLLPNPPITEAQIELMRNDNVASKTSPGLAELGVTPTPMSDVVPEYVS